ncbi:vitamin K epoxide reductase family protein [Galbitalea sp. SE-J8]|uniref:vitamin K epoxide reductase family protein n=1 Tax=Galbitalea sp. SE-J8 TaxID=3054952 RepID=UPI00259D0D11|nr:vitamin K epoxide reductase family protein [Galbitalea sp. SE-J8]MDM4761691.1 vitamin K epoxide reductase family protein [Galbitalea sp. SE-J8]
MSDAPARRVPWILSVWLIVAGVIGVWAAFELTLDRIASVEHPHAALSCDFSLLVQCTANLDSWQGSVFGFPNPIIGLVAWPATIVVGAGLLARARFARWYWALFNLGVLGAFVFIIFLSTQSIWAQNLHTLCPWCMLTWSVTIPTFWAVTFRNLREGVFGRARALTAIGRFGSTWIVVIVILSYLAIAVEAQLSLDVLRYVF